MDHRNIMQGVIVRIALAVFGLLTVGMLLLGVINDKGAIAVHRRVIQVKAAEENNQALEAENKKLTDDIDALQNDPAAIEKLAREQLGLVKKDEIILVLPEEPAPAKK